MTLDIRFECLIWRLSFFVVVNAVVVEEEGQRGDGCFCVCVRLMEDFKGRGGRACGQLAGRDMTSSA